MTSTQFRSTAGALILATAFTLAGCVVEDADDGAMPEFDCSDRSAMQPDTTLVRNLGTDTATFIGQFGNPDNGHTITFMLTYDSEDGNTYEAVGVVTDYGRTSITVQFDVAEADCDTGQGPGPENRYDCDVPYRLSVMVDGEPYCSQNNYGDIHTYWDDMGGF